MDKTRSEHGVTYRVRVAGVVDPRWSAWLDDFEIVPAGGETLMTGEVPDQAALHGLLTKIRDMNLVLLSLERLL
jgi:hypothetical protein